MPECNTRHALIRSIQYTPGEGHRVLTFAVKPAYSRWRQNWSESCGQLLPLDTFRPHISFIRVQLADWCLKIFFVLNYDVTSNKNKLSSKLIKSNGKLFCQKKKNRLGPRQAHITSLLKKRIKETNETAYECESCLLMDKALFLVDKWNQTYLLVKKQEQR